MKAVRNGIGSSCPYFCGIACACEEFCPHCNLHLKYIGLVYRFAKQQVQSSSKFLTWKSDAAETGATQMNWVPFLSLVITFKDAAQYSDIADLTQQLAVKQEDASV